MGLFAFCSGYFYKESNEEHIWKYIWKKFRRLIIPMYIWNVIYGIFVQITRLKGFTIGRDFNIYNLTIAPIISGHQFTYNLCFWFVVTLFIVETFNIVFRKIMKKIHISNEYLIFIIYLILGFVGVILSTKGYNKLYYLPLVRFLYILPFYGFGTLYNRKLEKIDKLNNMLYFCIIIIIQLLIITMHKGNLKYTVAWCNDFTEEFYMPFIVGFLAIGFWIRISKIIEPLIKESRVINSIANNSFAIMAHQFVRFYVCKMRICTFKQNCSTFL